MIWLLLLAFAAILVGGLLSLHLLLATGIVLCITAMATLKCRPRWLALVFGVWMETVLIYLLISRDDSTSGLGLPWPALVMLVGVWLLPIILWPVGFALFYRDWMDRQ